METTVTISSKEYEELKLFKKLVENNLKDELSEEELKTIEKARKEKGMSEEDFLKKHPYLAG